MAKKKIEPVKDPAQIDLEKAIAAQRDNRPDGDLIAEYHKLDAYMDAQLAALTEFLKPTREKVERIKTELQTRLIQNKANRIATDFGTAYLSTITNHKIDPAGLPYVRRDPGGETVTSTGRDAVIDWLFENWDEYGNEGIQVGVSKDIVNKYIEKENKPPPGLTISTFKRLNINKA